MRVFTSPEDLTAAVGEHLGYSDWHVIDQDRVNKFADATGDHQWIHVDTEKAAAGPFGTTIAHGFLSLSLFPALTPEIYAIEGVKMGINYGTNKVRFPSPLPVGSKVRAGATLLSVEQTRDGGYQVTNEVTLEREGGEKPICVAQTVARLYF
jgi:acyl dehydratase